MEGASLEAYELLWKLQMMCVGMGWLAKTAPGSLPSPSAAFIVRCFVVVAAGGELVRDGRTKAILKMSLHGDSSTNLEA